MYSDWSAESRAVDSAMHCLHDSIPKEEYHGQLENSGERSVDGRREDRRRRGQDPEKIALRRRQDRRRGGAIPRRTTRPGPEKSQGEEDHPQPAIREAVLRGARKERP